MGANKCWILMIITACFIAILCGRFSIIFGNEEQQMKFFGISTLSGIKEVTPTVDLMILGDEEANKPQSLSESELQTQVELALRMAGIKVAKGKSDALLQVNILVTRDSIGEKVMRVAMESMSLDPQASNYRIYIYSVSIGLWQEVELQRNNTIRTLAQTWPLLGMAYWQGISAANQLSVEEGIKNDVNLQINEFINDYLAANTKVDSTKEIDNESKVPFRLLPENDKSPKDN